MNALDVVRLAFSGLDAMRQQVTPDIRVPSIITHGGDAPDIIPKGTSMRVFLRASTKEYFNDSSVPRAKNIFEGAALMTGAKVEIREAAKAYENMITNERLAERFGDHSNRIGCTAQPIEPERFGGSTDKGNVSQRIPALHAYLAIDDHARPHTLEFAEAARSERGDATVLDGARILGSLAYDLLVDKTLSEVVKSETKKSKA